MYVSLWLLLCDFLQSSASNWANRPNYWQYLSTSQRIRTQSKYIHEEMYLLLNMMAFILFYFICCTSEQDRNCAPNSVCGVLFSKVDKTYVDDTNIRISLSKLWRGKMIELSYVEMTLWWVIRCDAESR